MAYEIIWSKDARENTVANQQVILLNIVDSRRKIS